MPEPSRWWEFEQFVREILRRTPGISIPGRADSLFPSPARKDLGFDIEAVRDGRPLLVEIKSQTPQTSARLTEMTHQLRAAAKSVIATDPGMRPELLAVFPGPVSRSKQEFARQDRVEIWDGRELRRRARRSVFMYQPLLPPSKAKSAPKIENRPRLTERLAQIQPGRLDAPAYEKWCEDVLNFLFCPPLNPPIVQHRDNVGANRRDLIMPNYATRGFWHFMRNHYGADFIVAEAKNLTSAISKPAVLQLANYLSRHGTGLFGILLPGTAWTPAPSGRGANTGYYTTR